MRRYLPRRIGRGVQTAPISGALDRLIRDLPHHLKAPQALFFMSPDSNGWVAFHSSWPDGWHTLVNFLAASLGDVDALFFLSRGIHGTFTGAQIEGYRNGKSVRVVQTSLEGSRWKYFARGEKLAFEDATTEKNRSISSRLDRSVVERYFSSVGVDLVALPQTNVDAGFRLVT